MSGPGEALFAFVRHWSRRWNAQSEGVAARNGRHVLVTEAVRALASRGPVTVNAVAGEIGVDQSGASRLVKDAVAAGYLELTASEEDGRRREITLSASGAALLEDAHRWQEQVFAQLTDGWTARQRRDFHRAMLRLVERSRAGRDGD